MHLNGISLTNIRCFKGHHELQLCPGLNVIVGKNNSGKSSILKAPFIVSHFFASEVSNIAYRKTSKYRDPFLRQGDCEDEDSSVCVSFVGNGSDYKAMFPNKTPLHEFGYNARESSEKSVPYVYGDPSFCHWNLKVDTPLRLEVGVHLRNSRLGGTFTPFVRFYSQGSQQSAFRYYEFAISTNGNVVWDNEKKLGYSSACMLGGRPSNTLDSVMKKLNSIPTFLQHFFNSWSSPQFHQVGDFGGSIERPFYDDRDVQDHLVNLKLTQDNRLAYQPVRDLFLSNFPEYADIHFHKMTPSNGHDVHRPRFQLRYHGNPLGDIARVGEEDIGTGASRFLELALVSRISYLSGARALFFDEPHLYLHPKLERELLQHWSVDGRWSSSPPQLICATHSPTFMNAAWRNGKIFALSWDDDHTGVSIETCARGSSVDESQLSVAMATVYDQPSDCYFADDVLFVEGVSDKLAIEALLPVFGVNPNVIRIIPLQEPDSNLNKGSIKQLPKIALSTSGLFRNRPKLLLDSDKEKQCRKAWRSLSSDEHPDNTLNLFYAGRELGDGDKSDIESYFCVSAVLEAAYDSGKFLSDGDDQHVAISDWGPIRKRVGEFNSNNESGSAFLKRWFTEVLDCEYKKTQFLPALAAFVAKNTEHDGVRNILSGMNGLAKFLGGSVDKWRQTTR